jgi:cytochrome c-type biogenesis protein CcmH/NrfF
MQMLGELFGVDWLFWYQPILLVVLIAIIVAYKMYRSKQM